MMRQSLPIINRILSVCNSRSGKSFQLVPFNCNRGLLLRQLIWKDLKQVRNVQYVASHGFTKDIVKLYSVRELIIKGIGFLDNFAYLNLNEKEDRNIRQNLFIVLSELYTRKHVNFLPYFNKISEHNALCEDSYTLF